MLKQPPSISLPLEQKLSCKRCRFRKLKCNRTVPCTNCTAAGSACDYAQVDRRRTPPSSEYTKSLEKRVASLEAYIKRLRAAPSAERDEILDSKTTNIAPSSADTNADGERTSASPDPSVPGSSVRAHLHLDAEGSLIYHGATSIFNDDTTTNERHEISAQCAHDTSNFEHVLEHFGIALEDETVLMALTQFFRWQYPHFMFVYREAFLRDHFGARENGKYWSSALLMSICALGLLMSRTKHDRSLSEQFFLAAESIVMVSGFTRPSIPTVQAFLCLAFYEVGRGNISKGWGFSGIAFRMAQDLGFQNDPTTWVSQDSTLVTSEDVEIRRRIYWGCYISDKLISMVLGRPVQLAFDQAEVGPLETIPDGPEMGYWRPVGFDDDPNNLGSSSNIPYLMEQIRLSKIVETMMTILFLPGTKPDSTSRRTYIENLNIELMKWRDSLPTFARWSKWMQGSLMTPAVATLHLLYHSSRIALNFDQAISNRDESAGQSSLQYCTSSTQEIVALVRNYKMQYGLHYSPLVLIYAAVQASRCSKAFGIAEEHEYLLASLADCAQSWRIAGMTPASLPSSGLSGF